MASTLAPYELFKYDFRLKLFLDKYKNGESFMLLSGSRVNLVFDPEIYVRLRKKDRIFAQNVLFEDARSRGSINRRYRLSQFKKTEEFGGREAAGRVYEDNQISEINEQFGDVMKKSGEDFVRIEFKNKIFRVTHAAKTAIGVKSDIHLVNESGSEVFWISYKRGSVPRDINGWSGITSFSDYPEATEFVEKVRDLCSLNDNTIWPGVTFARKIRSQEIIKRAVYGMDYNKMGAYGRNNVQQVIQGRIRLVKVGRFYKLTGNKTIDNGAALSGEHSNYLPVFMAIHKGADRANFGIKNARFDIYPMMGRAVTQWV